MSADAEREVQEIVDLETRAWSEKNVELLLGVFHPDMVWPWPPSESAHDPVEWVWGMGRFNAARWRRSYEEFFAAHDLIHNRRKTIRIAISPEGDAAFAVVDVDTLWRKKADGSTSQWKGRACKVYTSVAGEWKMTMHTGLLDYTPHTQ
jgi:ketosteroid isomerase-like protein